jgi:hypothetical protein
VKEKGRLFESRGKTSPEHMYSGGCIFVDHCTGYIFVHYHVHQTALETIEDKQRFEQHMFEHGVIVQSYHTDNGIFTARDFIKEIETNH